VKVAYYGEVFFKKLLLNYDGPTITVFDGRNIFPISFMPFYVLEEFRPAFTFIV
jgi:hypothetical protein